METRIEVQREHARLRPLSDDSAPLVNELERKLGAIDYTIEHLLNHGLAPDGAAEPQDA